MPYYGVIDSIIAPHCCRADQFRCHDSGGKQAANSNVAEPVTRPTTKRWPSVLVCPTSTCQASLEPRPSNRPTLRVHLNIARQKSRLLSAIASEIAIAPPGFLLCGSYSRLSAFSSRFLGPDAPPRFFFPTCDFDANLLPGHPEDCLLRMSPASRPPVSNLLSAPISSPRPTNRRHTS